MKTDKRNGLFAKLKSHYYFFLAALFFPVAAHAKSGVFEGLFEILGNLKRGIKELISTAPYFIIFIGVGAMVWGGNELYQSVKEGSEANARHSKAKGLGSLFVGVILVCMPFIVGDFAITLGGSMPKAFTDEAL